MAPSAEDMPATSEIGGIALSSASILGLVDNITLPKTAAEFQKMRFHTAQAQYGPVHFFRVATPRLVRTHHELEKEFPGGNKAVYNVISSISLLLQMGNLTLAEEKTLHIRWILETITGDNPLARGPYSYPEALKNDAQAVLDAVNEHLPIVEEVPIEESSDRSLQGETSTASRSHKRRRTVAQQAAAPAAPPPISLESLTSTLRGLIRSEGRRTYSLDKTVTRPCNVFGHNGIAVGTWWPLRICALRDGAHGSSMGGISGTTYDGAYSVVVSGGYVDLDKDVGGTIYYSGSKSHDNTDPNSPILTHSTKALQTSRRDNRSVRVLRAAGGVPKYAPYVGLRYDGLYMIADECIEINKKGGAYIRFTLIRRNDQEEIDLSRPNARERAISERMKQL